MSIQTHTTFSNEKVEIKLTGFNTTITIIETTKLHKNLNNEAIYLLFNQKNLLSIGNKTLIRQHADSSFTQLIEVTSFNDIELIYLERFLQNLAIENGIGLADISEQIIPDNIQKNMIDLTTSILLVLEKFGYIFKPIKPKPTKARHKWTTEVSKIEFFINTRNSKATVMWVKRNQMLIKKGAIMMKEAPLNKDGSVGFSAKMGDKIRSEHQSQFNKFLTTEDISLKSVNEVGLFLYFGGTNSWLEMIDSNGKTLNEWTVAE